MMYFIAKAALSGLIIALVSELAKRSPSLGALVVSLPLISILAMIWLWRDTEDAARLAAHAEATFWYVNSKPSHVLAHARAAAPRG
jgi:hypothetical protein